MGKQCALQFAPSNGSGGLNNYAHVRDIQWPMGLETNPCQFSSVTSLCTRLKRTVRQTTARPVQLSFR